MSEQTLWERLDAPFEADEVKWKPQSITKDQTRALAICYVDARVVMDRLDEVLGLGCWQTHYREMSKGVVCTLRVRIGTEWFEHEDVGNFSEQPDEGDQFKAAFSDSLKRAAVHIGIGRYLYRLPHQWVAYDDDKRRLVETPKLPDWALPDPSAKLREKTLPVLQGAAREGLKALETAWKCLSGPAKVACQHDLPPLKEQAQTVDLQHA